MEDVVTDQEIISEFIHRLLREHSYDDKVATSDSLILSGLLDSLAIDFSELYFDQASFDSIDQILEFVQVNKPEQGH